VRILLLMAEAQPAYAGQQMTSSKQIQSESPLRIPRSGHGAASVIPHLRDVVQLEPSHLEEAMDDEDGTWRAEPKPACGASSDTSPNGG
jgi:hypothetical protein